LFESLDNRILFINQNFCELFGIPVSSDILIGTDCSAAAKQSAHLFKHPNQFIDGILSIYQQQQQVTNEELVFANGSTIYRDYKPILNHPHFSGHLWIYKNAVELKSILGEIQEQKDFYEQLLNNIPADIAIFDKNHQYLFLNKIAISKTDTRHWLIGKDDFDYCKENNKPIELAESRRQFFNEAIFTKQTIEFEEINHTKEGQQVYNLRRFYPLQNPDGSIETIIGYGINITKVREREEKVLARERAFRELVESMDQLVVVINKEGYIKYTNTQWSLLTGISAAESIDKLLFSFVKIKKIKFTENVLSFIATKKYKNPSKRVCFNDKNGKIRTFVHHITTFTNAASIDNSYAVFFNDITSQLEAEKKLRKIARQERKLNDLKSNFIGLVSHELRTPLSVILSNAELIQLKANNHKQGQPHLYDINTKRIIDQVSKMTQLMNDFLLLGKIEMDKIPMNPTCFNIENLIDKLVEELYTPWTDGRVLQLSVKGNQREVYADEAMIRNTLINLINNAFKYSPGKLAPVIRLRFTEKTWYLLVVDTGIGISTEDQKRLYEPFIRGGNVEDIEGTGLGLIIVKYFVKKNKGKMLLKSSKNKGTAVYLQFPY
jgi:PAS domain S-box-containing protein